MNDQTTTYVANLQAVKAEALRTEPAIAAMQNSVERLRVTTQTSQSVLKMCHSQLQSISGASGVLNDSLAVSELVSNQASESIVIYGTVLNAQKNVIEEAGNSEKNTFDTIISGVKEMGDVISGIIAPISAFNEIETFANSNARKAIAEKTKAVYDSIKAYVQSINLKETLKQGLDALKGSYYSCKIAVLSFKKAINQKTKALFDSIKGYTATITWQTIYMMSAFGAALATHTFTKAINSLSTAIFNIPLVGWILAIVTALVALFTYLWENCQRFREILFGIWELIKYWFDGAIQAIVGIWDGIVQFFVNLKNQIWNTIVGIYDSIVSNLGVVGEWFETYIGNPVKECFSGIWDFIQETIDNVINKLDGMLEPIRSLWNKLFPKDVWEKGEIKGKVSFENSKKEKNDAIITTSSQKKTTLIPTSPTPEISPSTQTMTESTVSGGSRSNVVNINLRNLVENIKFEGGVGENKEEVVGTIERSLLQVLTMANTAQ